MHKLIRILLPLLTLQSCTEVKDIFHKTTPHEKYQNMLVESGLSEYELGKAWIHTAQNVLSDSLFIDIPYTEKTYFSAHEVQAYAYRFHASQGEQINIEVQILQGNPIIFADLYKSANELEHVISADSNDISYVVKESSEYILRLQPELMKSGNFELKITSSPTLAFPVAGVNAEKILSFWGDTRDAGRREHKGVDIFAERGTPVIAAADGIIFRTGTNRLGGKVVWLYTKNNQNHYYAHLDSQLVNPGAVIKRGDTLGLVGNTGNAITTPPHLHFGIYIPGEGAVDPFPFINNISPAIPVVNADTAVIGNWAKVKTSGAKLVNGFKDTTLKKNTPFKVHAASFGTYRIKMPDGFTGFINNNAAQSIEASKQVRTLQTDKNLHEAPDTNAAIISYLDKSERVSIIGEYSGFYMINYKNKHAWIVK